MILSIERELSDSNIRFNAKTYPLLRSSILFPNTMVTAESPLGDMCG